MDEKLAAQIMSEIDRVNEVFNRLTELSFKIPREDERVDFRRCIGSLMATLITDVKMPILSKFPNLDKE